jgi:hypothetical protein
MDAFCPIITGEKTSNKNSRFFLSMVIGIRLKIFYADN